MVVFDLQVDQDDFMLLTTDGILSGMSIHQIVNFALLRLTSF